MCPGAPGNLIRRNRVRSRGCLGASLVQSAKEQQRLRDTDERCRIVRSRFDEARVRTEGVFWPPKPELEPADFAPHIRHLRLFRDDLPKRCQGGLGLTLAHQRERGAVLLEYLYLVLRIGQ